MVRIRMPLREYKKVYKGKKIYWFTTNYYWLCDYDSEDLPIISNPMVLYSHDEDDEYLTDSDTYPDYFALAEKVEIYCERSDSLALIAGLTGDTICMDEVIVNLELKDKIFLGAVTIR